MYQQVRDLREANIAEAELFDFLDTLQTEYPDDWLLCVEIFEYAIKTNNKELKEKASGYLDQMKSEYPQHAHLIENARVL